jgi:hypothetical protein
VTTTGLTNFDRVVIGGMTSACSYTPSTLIEVNGDDLRRDTLEVRIGDPGRYRGEGSPASG